MARRRNNDQGSTNTLGWMLTFGDLVTLLLTFFVMLLSLKAPEVDKFQYMMEGLFVDGGQGLLDAPDADEKKEMKRMKSLLAESGGAKAINRREAELAKALGLPSALEAGLAGSLQKTVSIRHDNRGTVITLANDLLFAPGGANLNARAIEAIDKVAKILKYSDLPIMVEGHTDDLNPLATTRFRDNWDLSLARAHAVLKQLEGLDKVPAWRLSLAAMGSTKPLAPNNTKKNRAKNRRTEIIIQTNKS